MTDPNKAPTEIEALVARALHDVEDISGRIRAGGYRANLSDTEHLRNHVRRLANILQTAPRQEQSASEPGVSDFPTPIEICRAYGVSGAAAAQLALILNPDGKTTLARLTSGPVETTLIHAKQDGRIERLRPSAEEAAAGDRPLTDRVAEPAGARYPGEHGESKGGHGDDPMLSGSHGPHHTPVAQSVEPAGRTTHPDIAAVREALRRAIASAQHVTQHFTLLDTAWLFAAQNSLSRLEAKLSAPAVSVEDAGREALREIKRQYETASNHGADAIDVIYDIVRKALQDG